ncbi:MAG: DNA recombination protein RmuC [Candidatus Omnitrophica bacterium]|nr:DNA recombination protein RmuC [Candidatus Omnitrophota bacterium]
MLIITGLLGLFVLTGIVVYLWLLLAKTTRAIQSELAAMTARVGSHLEQTARFTQQTGEGAVKAISDVYSRLGYLEESSRKIFEVGQEIGKLQDVLRAPKARGNFGELMLADMLGQIIPRDHFQLQYAFRNGTRVDAAIFVGNHMVPIDAKFPLENFQRIIATQAPEERKRARKEFIRDVKKHVDVISERYISPEEGTLDFALMYVPAENVYYEVIASDDESESYTLSSYALSRRVIPVSPNSFYAYLQVILFGLRGLRMDHAAREIAESLMKMQSDFKKIGEDFGVLGTHLNHAKGAFEKVQRGVDQFQVKINLVDQMKMKVPVIENEILGPSGVLKNEN